MIEKEHFKMWRKPRMKMLNIWRLEIEQWVGLQEQSDNNLNN